MSWTEEKVNKLKELWGKGQTASQIAEIIGGISRNAVIGKAHRLNLSAKIKTRSAVASNNSLKLNDNTSQKVIINTNTNTKINLLINVIDIIRDLGIDNVALVTEK